MRQLATYAFANARVRAMLSYLIDPQAFASLLDSKNIYELIDALKKTDYKDVFADVNPYSLDLIALEKKLLSKDIMIYRKVYDSLPGKAQKEFVSILMQRYEIEDLKVILRLWYSKEPVMVEDYVLGQTIKFDIDYKKIASAQTIEDVIALLDGTDYTAPLMAALDKFKAAKSLFYLEAALDTDYYGRLIESIGKFPSADKKAASKIIGIEADGENMQWLIKLRNYYKLPLSEMLEWFMPGGSIISKGALSNFYASDGMAKIMEGLALGPYMPVKDLAEENIRLIDNILYETLLKEVRRMLAGNPFTIGTILGYLILKKRETRNVISLLYAKACGMKKDELSRLIPDFS